MFDYKRKTSFIDYYINGVKGRNIGVAKQRIQNGEYSVSVDICGLEGCKNVPCNISAGNAKGKKKLFIVDIRNGRGHGEYHSTELSENEEYDRLFFELGNNCYGITELYRLPKEESGMYQEDEVPVEEAVYESIEEDIEEKKPEEDDLQLLTQEEEELISEDVEKQPDKWETIKKKYPILYPFRGQGPYVSIKPVDLQLLNQKYHHLCNNSYLMHGFYQYRHMILGEYSMEKGTYFYVGVPGEFIKKEQSAAAMFGFEGYEHSGDLGYYLYRVEL